MFTTTVCRSTDPRFPVGTVLCATDTLDEADNFHDEFMALNGEPDINVRFAETNSSWVSAETW